MRFWVLLAGFSAFVMGSARGEGVPGSEISALKWLAREVAVVRGLTLKRDLPTRIVSPDQLAAFLDDELDDARIADLAKVYVKLGFMRADEDLAARLRALD